MKNVRCVCQTHFGAPIQSRVGVCPVIAHQLQRNESGTGPNCMQPHHHSFFFSCVCVRFGYKLKNPKTKISQNSNKLLAFEMKTPKFAPTVMVFVEPTNIYIYVCSTNVHVEQCISGCTKYVFVRPLLIFLYSYYAVYILHFRVVLFFSFYTLCRSGAHARTVALTEKYLFILMEDKEKTGTQCVCARESKKHTHLI